MNHVMFDIETLGQGPNAAITSIAAVQFDIKTGKIGATFNENVSLESNVAAGRDIEPSTLRWWLKQSPDALKGLTESLDKGGLIKDVLYHLRLFLYRLKDENNNSVGDNLYVWGRGPRFDMAILTHAYTSFGNDIPWEFRNENCVRTMEFLNPAIKKATKKADQTGHGSEGGGLHNALLDAEYQIAYVSAIYQYCKGIKPYEKPLELKDIPGNKF